MKKQITVIIYNKSNDTVGYSAEFRKVWFWVNTRKIQQEILWKLLKENKIKQTVITNIQIF